MKVIDREFKHATFKRATENSDDIHFVKEIVTYEDGTTEPKLKILRNYKRPFWITKKQYRNHKQVKEAEDIDKLERYLSTESDLPRNISKAMKRQKFGRVSMRDVLSMKDSQYIYGATVDSVTMIALDYKKLSNTITPYRVGFLDLENHPLEKIISVVTFVYRDSKDKRVKVNTFINKREMPILRDVDQTVPKRFKEIMPDDITIDEIDFNIKYLDGEKDLLITLFDKLHSEPIDILTGWNFLYDITEIKDACIRVGLNPARMFSHPSVPDKDVFFEIQVAPSSKTKENGDVVSVPIEERWHKFNSASMFKMVDYMSSYKYIRLQEPKLKGGYGFDNVMKSMNLFGKLKGVELPPLTKIDWHLTMLRDYPLDYVAYNIWDTLALLYKDEIDKDLSLKLPMFCGISSINKFNSNTNRLYDDFFALYLEENKVIANKLINKPNLESLGRDDWTITVNLWKHDTRYFEDIVEDSYIQYEDLSKTNLDTLIKNGYGNRPRMIKSRTLSLLLDLDVVSAYPSVCSALNVSADTVSRELIKMRNRDGIIDKELMKHRNIGLISGVTADIKYATDMFNMPTLIELDEFIKEYYPHMN